MSVRGVSEGVADDVDRSGIPATLTWKKVVVAFVIGVVLREVLVGAPTGPQQPKGDAHNSGPSWLQSLLPSSSREGGENASHRSNSGVDVLAPLRIPGDASIDFPDTAGKLSPTVRPIVNEALPPMELLSSPARNLQGTVISFWTTRLTSILNTWLDELLVHNASSSILPNQCPQWHLKSDTFVRRAPRVIFADHVNIFETVPGVHTKRLSVDHKPIFMRYPNISQLDMEFGPPRHAGFRHTSRFRRFFGRLHKSDSSAATFPQWTMADGPYFVSALPNAFLTFRDHIILCDDSSVGMHLSSCLRTGHLVRKAKPSNTLIVPPKFPTFPVVIPLCSKGTCRWGGPFHLIVEHLARIAPLAGLIKHRSDTFLLVTGDEVVEPMIYKFLALMGIGKDKVINIPSGARANLLLYSPVACFRPLPFALKAFREVIFHELHFEPSKEHQEAARSPRLVFAERMAGKGSWRAPGNYMKIKAAITSFCNFVGFSHTTVNDIAETTTIREFANADVVVGVHGANLAPVIFMKSGATLVEFLARKLHPLCFYHVASLLGVEHFPIFYDFPHFHDGPPSISPMHVLMQVVGAMRVPSGLWVRFLLGHHPMLKHGNLSEGLPLTNSGGGELSCDSKLDSIPVLIVANRGLGKHRAFLMHCQQRGVGADGPRSLTYLCDDVTEGWNCSESNAADLTMAFATMSFTLLSFSENRVDAALLLSGGPAHQLSLCSDERPCKLSFVPFFARE